jgi:hypothetical protein
MVVTGSLLSSTLISTTQFVKAQTNKRDLRLKEIDTVKELPSKAKRWALVIGIDEYRDRQINSLKGATNDARMLADALAHYAGFPRDQIILLATDQPEERQPTRVNILRRLSNLASVVPKDGLLLISFAGHGMERSGQAYLLPSDAQISNDVTFLEETAISVSRMRDRIRATGVDQVLVLLDACRNDPTGRADAPNWLTEAYTRGFNFDVRNREVKAFATLYATEIGDRAYEYTEKQQGYFTWAVVEGLKGGAANEKKEITLAALLRYVQEVVPKRIRIDLGAGKQQRPFAIVEGYKAEELVIAVAKASFVPVVEDQPSIVSQTNNSYVLELSHWNRIKGSTKPEDYKAFLKEYPNGKFAAQAKAQLDFVEAAASVGSESTNDGFAIVAQANVFPKGRLAAKSFMLISSSGGRRFGASNAKVIVNGRDVSEQITDQSDYMIKLEGTSQKLNLKSGENEVIVKIGTVSSQPYTFTKKF